MFSDFTGAEAPVETDQARDPWTTDPILAGSMLAQADAAARDELIAFFAAASAIASAQGQSQPFMVAA
jgi:hypothetical protein